MSPMNQHVFVYSMIKKFWAPETALTPDAHIRNKVPEEGLGAHESARGTTHNAHDDTLE